MNRRRFTLSAFMALLFAPSCRSKPKPPPRSLFVGVQVDLSRERINELRARASNSPQFDSEEVMVGYEGQEKRMTYDEFLIRMGIRVNNS